MHCIRNKIFPSGKNFSDRTHLCRYMLDTVNDRSVFGTENDVAVFPHDFNNELLLAKVAQLIKMFDCKQMIRSSFGCEISVIRLLLICFLRSIQKLGAVIGLGLFVSVR